MYLKQRPEELEKLFTPLAPYGTPDALDRICEEYNRVIGNMEVEPLIAIPVFIHDFLLLKLNFLLLRL